MKQGFECGVCTCQSVIDVEYMYCAVTSVGMAVAMCARLLLLLL
jgi:hypothetical protein